MTAPVDNLVRARYDVGTVGLRAADDGATGRTLFGHFAVFDRWTEIDSWYEGRFIERLKRGAFKRTLKERAGQIRVLYEHGRDPSIGNKLLGAPANMREDSEGAYGECELYERPYVDDLIPALRDGQLGQSFRFRVAAEAWVEPKKESDHNPGKLPERTITDVDLYEWGPCPFPAYADASAGVRSGTDPFLESLLNDPAFLARFAERTNPHIVQHILASVPGNVRIEAASNVPGNVGSEQASRTSALLAVQRARLLLASP